MLAGPTNSNASDILLVTLNSTYQHASFGLRYLLANLGPVLQPRARILEWTIHASTRDIAEKILALKPKIVGLGVYVWNTAETLYLVRLLKKLAPSLPVILGGPEVSHEVSEQEIVKAADYVITGEADFLFRELCESLLLRDQKPLAKIISGPLPEVSEVVSPYDHYSDEDIKNRVIYVEASRGCPYRCEYCLSSLDKGVRNFPIDSFLAEMKKLLHRGVRQFKFVDRTFNLSPDISSRILQFFLDHVELGLFLHFEMVPDRLPDALKSLIEKFPSGSLQFEIGIQTWSPEVAKNISRNQNYDRIRANFEHLTKKTKVHLHADLIVGLPGETLDSFRQGFNALSQLQPHEIQVGLLKRLKGTPITKKEALFQLQYQDHPPFQILRSSTMDYETVQRLERFSRVWNLVANQGRFARSVEMIQSALPADGWFDFWWLLTENFERRFNALYAIHPDRLAQGLLEFAQGFGIPSEDLRNQMIEDYRLSQPRGHLPQFLRPTTSLNTQTSDSIRASTKAPEAKKASTPPRQHLHLRRLRSEADSKTPS